MNALTLNAAPLPSILTQAGTPSGPHRRHRLGRFQPTKGGIDRFNRLLVRLGREQAPLQADQLATAARQLLDAQPGGAVPECIAQRLRQAEVVGRMLADAAWQPAAAALPLARDLLAYVQGDDDLIPDALPRLGRLDDAIVVDTAWPRLAGELACYADFSRLRIVEARLRGCHVQDFSFDRRDWKTARATEAALLAHRRHVRESSYAPAPADCFRVH